MPIVRKKHDADYIFQGGPYAPGQLRVVRFHGTEAISTPFNFELDLAATEEVNFDTMVGTPGILTIHSLNGKRYVNGIISRFELTGKGLKFRRYAAEIVPKFWLLTHIKNIRIFQEKSTVDILKQVLAERCISGDEVRFSLSKQYEPRQYCVQYRETDFDFLSRLMEEEGIFYFFDHDEQKHTMIFGDNQAVHVPIPAPSRILFHVATKGLIEDEEHLYHFNFSKAIQSGAVRLKDFDFKKPRLNLETLSGASERPDLEIYDYPGRYVKTNRGEHLSKVRIEQSQSMVRLGTGRSDCRRMMAGFNFTLDQYYHQSLNQEYLITEVTHWAEETQTLETEPGAGNEDVRIYDNAFTCMPVSIPFRPPKVTPPAIVHGTQTAIVVGPKGEEIYTDEFGRVKVQFHWDREGKYDEKSSCWIRVSQGWAGQNWGMMFLPRVGQEVIVDFIEGDPDRPIITGRVYNGEKKVPYDLPNEKTKSTVLSNSSLGGGGSNEIRFEDKKGKEEIYVHAQKDKNVKVENNRSKIIGNNDDLDVQKGNRTIKVLKGTYDLTAKDIKITGLNSIEIVCSAGSIKFDAAGNISIKGPKLESLASILNDIKGGIVKINS